MVAVKAGDAERALKTRSAEIALILFFGPDAGLVAERAGAAARSSVPDPDDPFSLVRMAGDDIADEPGRLVEEATTFALFGGKRAIWVRPTSRNIASAVQACLDVGPTDATIVVEAGDLSRTSPLRAVCEKSPRALAVPCYPDAGRDLATVVTDALREGAFTIEPDARTLLIDSLGGDRLATRGELAKLMLYAHGQTRITERDIEAVVSDVSSPDVDSAIDHAFLGRFEALEDDLGKLGGRGAAILALTLRHALTLAAGLAQMEEGATLDGAIRGFRGLHFRRKDDVARQLGRWTLPRALGALRMINEAVADSRRTSLSADLLASATLTTVARAAAGRSAAGG